MHRCQSAAPRYVSFEGDLPNECWQADFTHWPLADGAYTEILCFLDDHARVAISLAAHRLVTAQLVLDTFRAACITHGMPASTLTDDGRVFTTLTTTGARTASTANWGTSPLDPG